MTPPRADREAVLARLGVSRETAARLDVFLALLAERQGEGNLVSGPSLPLAWRRHVEDSAQVHRLASKARRWADLGTGAGFPGLVTAILLADEPGAVVHLIERDRRKTAFLREVADATGAPASVHEGGIGTVAPTLAGTIDAVSARALAPLPDLLNLAEPLLTAGAVGYFMKGRTVADEVAAARHHWRFTVELLPSRLDPAGRIVVVRDLMRRRGGRTAA